jgi:hypothetical protein
MERYLWPGTRIRILENVQEDYPESYLKYTGEKGRFLAAIPSERIEEGDTPSLVLVEFDDEERALIPLELIEIIDSE